MLRLVLPQVLAGIYPIAQIQEPYTAVGYLAARVPVQALLHLRHPEAEDPAAEHPWCAWDICEGGCRGLAPRPSACPVPAPQGFCHLPSYWPPRSVSQGQPGLCGGTFWGKLERLVRQLGS